VSTPVLDLGTFDESSQSAETVIVGSDELLMFKNKGQ